MSFSQTTADVSFDTKVSAAARAGRWEMAGAALCLAQFSEPLFAAIAQSQGLTEPPGYARIFFVPVYAFLAWTVWRDRRLAARSALAAPLMLGLIALAFVSTLWSIDPSATLRRSVWLALTMMFGAYLAWRYSWRALIEVVAGAYLVLIAGSFATALLAPSVGIMATEHPGAWCGLWTHKNMLGGYMALGVGVGVAAAFASPERWRLWTAVALGAFALVLLSTSKTALLATLLELAAMGAIALIRRGPLFTISVAAGAASALVIGLCIYLLAPDLLVSLIGRDLTLTGRTDIWSAAAPAVAARPWLGYGYYSFWLDANGPAYWVRQAVGWNVPSAHSGWLETALGLGRIGVALFALQLFASLRRGAKAAFDPNSNPLAGIWGPALLGAFALYTFSESHTLQANDLFWTIYVAVAARLALDAREAKHA